MGGKGERAEVLDQVCSEEKLNEDALESGSPVAEWMDAAREINFDALEGRPIVGNVMEALADFNVHLIGVYGSEDDDINGTLIQIVSRRLQRDGLFYPVVTVIVTRKPDVRKIQEDIAGQLKLTFNHKSKDKRAQQLIQRIKAERKILIALRDLHKALDLSEVGIPYGSDHTGCKILLTSRIEDVLSNHMHTQRNFKVV